MTVNIGEPVSLKCRAFGDPVPDILWMQNSLKIPENDPRYHLLRDGTLRIAEANTDVVGEYECMAQNVVGEAKSRPVRMAINYQSKKPKIVLRPSDITVSPLNNIVLHCVATGKLN